MPSNEDDRPSVQALLLADRVEVDPKSGKETIVGVIGRFRVASVPATSGSAAALFISLRNLKRSDGLSVRYRAADSDSFLLATPLRGLPSPMPNEDFHAFVRVPPLPIPRAGLYHLELLFNDKVIGSVHLSAYIG